MTRVHALEAAETALRSVPPQWPLAATVAVNPYLGHIGRCLAETSARLERTAGVRATMPREWYAARVADNHISGADLAEALQVGPDGLPNVAALKAAPPRDAPARVPTVADLAATVTGTDWPGLVAERIGHFAAGIFDAGQALWAAPTSGGAWAGWRTQGHYDLTPEIAGLTGFARFVAATPHTAEDALVEMVARLGLSEDALVIYFETLLADLGGWAQLARQRQFEAELDGRDDRTLFALLTVRLVFEAALHDHCGRAIAAPWADAIARHAAPCAPTLDDRIDAALQEATERSHQRRIAALLAADATPAPITRPALQAAFCIDVRSEPYRRALERMDERIETLGFAGFFGLPVAHQGFASDVVEKRLPVLLNPTLATRSGPGRDDPRDRSARYVARAKRAWGRFKLAAVSSFAFVEAMGPVYVTRLLRDALRWQGKPASGDPQPTVALALDERVGVAARVLSAMSLTERFAPIVLIAGHGAHVTNNPHASALQCGACGGYAGDVNARLLADLLNEREVRAGLEERGIAIPPDTRFIAALHDTTTDSVTLYDLEDVVPGSPHTLPIAHLRQWLDAASARARAARLPAASEGRVMTRARDWAQTRPEWGLAGCAAFIAAPRYRTAGRPLEGRVFLHEYDWRRDEDFAVLELILSAPVVVASWISLQYYGSVVAPEVFGAGNKLLHNVTGGVGVVEGGGGTLRSGLPWQSVHDGARFVHEPLRLSVYIEAPREAIGRILALHPDVRALFDNRWLHLFALDDRGAVAWRYAGDLGWTPETPAAVARENALERA